jgi:gamma-D-glutamyl-L-lysine dipeptidyl-peptidase
MNVSRLLICPFILVLILTSCLNSELDKYKVANDVIDQIRQSHAPDRRVAIMDIKATIYNDVILLSGETDRSEIPESLISKFAEKGLEAKSEINLLPESNLNGSIYGVINNSVSNIRSQPKHSAELATQALLGTNVKVLKKMGSWYLIQTPDKYISWIDAGGLVVMNENTHDVWNRAKKIIYLESSGYVFVSPELESGERVADIVMGCQLKLVSELEEYFEVQYPDGRVGFVEKSKSEKYNQWLTSIEFQKQLIKEKALGLMGTPYLWGGTSSKGMDCSGFTKTVYFMNGLIIPRDASQQVNEGLKVDTNLSFTGLEVGDLLFFGSPATDSTKQRTTHVGLWIGDNQFIHASKNVRISSVDENSPNYDEPNVKRYLGSQRYLKNITAGIKDLTEPLRLNK